MCDEACTEERILCDLCGHWSHYRCENLSTVEISELENTQQTNTCRGCVSTETMLRSDIISEESNTSRTEGGSEQTEQHDKCVSTTPIESLEKRDMWTNTAEQQSDKSALQKEYNKTIKQMESEIKRKDENIGDLAKQLATTRAYIIKLEQKVNSLPVLPVRAPGRLQLDLLAVFDVTFEGLIDQQSVTEDSTRPSFFEHAS